MHIRQKLALLFTLISLAILLVFALVIYFSASESREREFYDALRKEAVIKANLIFDAKVNQAVLQEIYKSNRKVINEVEVAIYTKDFKLLYHDAVEIDYVKETHEMIDEIIEKGEIKFYQKDWQVVGTTFTHDDENYAVVAAAFDNYGFNKLNHLKNNILFLLAIALIVVYLAGWFFAKKVLSPIYNMAKRAKEITVSNLDMRLNTTQKKDELNELAVTFNEMLDRLEHSFEAQREFVYNISHEFRTPLAALITELDLTLQKNRNGEDYKKALRSVLSDAKKLDKVSSSLLDLARANYDPNNINYKNVRVDEILMDAADEVQNSNSAFKVQISFASENLDNIIDIKGNEYLLKTAFINIIDNACKFSPDKSCEIVISLENDLIKISFVDEGVGINEDDKEKVFRPFFRGRNQSYTQGTGIGLPLTKRILDLHKAEIDINSVKGKGTKVYVVFYAENY